MVTQILLGDTNTKSVQQMLHVRHKYYNRATNTLVALSVYGACTLCMSMNEAYTEHACSVHRAWLSLKRSVHRACT